MEKIAIAVRDNEDYDYIYGFLILKSNVFDTSLFQRRLNDMRDEMGYDYNGDEITREVLKRYENDYKDVEFVRLATDEVFI